MLRRLLVLLSFLGAFAGVVFVAPEAQAGPGQAKRDEIRERIRAMRIARIIQVLDLDEKGASRLTPIIDRAYDQITAITKDSGEARRDLRLLVVNQPPDNGKINRLVDRLLANKTRVEEVESAMISDVRRVLTPSQVARLVVVLPEINHQIQQQIKRAAGLGAGGPGGRPGGGQGSGNGGGSGNDADDGF